MKWHRVLTALVVAALVAGVLSTPSAATSPARFSDGLFSSLTLTDTRPGAGLGPSPHLDHEPQSLSNTLLLGASASQNPGLVLYNNGGSPLSWELVEQTRVSRWRG
jgi:hypothetical protein